MQFLRALWFRLRALFQRRAVDSEVNDELAFHIQRETEENIKRGMAPDDASKLALARFGGVERFREACHDERDARWFDDAVGDLRHAFRLVRKNVVFSAAVIVTLALGVGATSTIFAIVNAVLLRPLPYVDPDRIIAPTQLRKGEDVQQATMRDFGAWRANAKTLSSVAMWFRARGVLTGSGDPEELIGTASTASLFTVLGTQPLLGRTYRAEEEVPGTPRVIVLSYGFWKSHFNGDSAIVGRTIQMNENTRTVIGVMPPEFDYPKSTQFWTALQRPPQTAADQNEYFTTVIARLRPGVEVETALAELQAIVKRLDSERAADSRGADVAIMTLHDRLLGPVGTPLSLLFGAVVLLLLVACANVANLTLARSAQRSREFAVRLAMGASRWRLARQLFVESALLAVIGGAAGAIIPVSVVGALVKLSPESVAGITDIRIDGTVIAFSAVITVITALLFGLTPAMTGYRNGAFAALKTGTSRVTSSKSQRAVRSALVVGQMAAALALLTGAGLITKSFSKAIAIDPGFQAENLMTARFSLSPARYDGNDAKVRALYSTIVAELRALPGVEAVALSDVMPLFGFMMSQKLKITPDDGSKVEVAVSAVTSDYPRAIGMKLREGRLFNSEDRLGSPPVAILTVKGARQLFPNGHAIGQRVKAQYGENADLQPVVVGIVEDVAQHSAEAVPLPHLFMSAEQVDGVATFIVIRGSMTPTALKANLTRILKAIDPLQPVSFFGSASEVLSKELAPRRLNSVLINAFAWLALLLSMIGLYGLIAHSVAARTSELGIRMALGAGHASVLRLILRQALTLAAIGIVLGVVLSFVLSKTTASMLYGVGAHDPAVFVLAPLLLASVALCACYIPARRATKVDPLIALRAD